MFRMPWYIRGSCIGTGVRFRGISCEDVSFGCNLAVTQRRILFLLSCFLPPNAAGMEVLLADDDDDDGEEEEAEDTLDDDYGGPRTQPGMPPLLPLPQQQRLLLAVPAGDDVQRELGRSVAEMALYKSVGTVKAATAVAEKSKVDILQQLQLLRRQRRQPRRFPGGI